ncbi:MAG: insulinase family protein [Acidobacteria bacterium]|nr:insulinase family protein [Acidobacteriota bacterium]
MSRWALLAASFTFCLPLILLAQQKSSTGKEAQTRKGDLLPFQATERTLANGLKVIVVPTGFPNIVSIQIPVQTGSRNEVEPGKSGFAHFFEHMMFRGTAAYPPDKYQAILTKAGARQNAYTTDDYTNYHITFAKEDLETMLKIEADRFQSLSYPEAAFKTEALAVLGEYNKNSANPMNKLIEVQRDHAFTTHTYKHTTMGFLCDIEDMPNQFQYSKLFFDRWYRPEYTTLIIAGDVKAEEALPLVEKYWSGWKRGSFRITIPAEPPPKGPIYAHVPWLDKTLPWVTIAFHGPAFSDVNKDFAAVDALVDLNFGQTSDVYKRLVEQEQKVDQLIPYFPPTQDPSLVTILARVKRMEDVLSVRDELLKAAAAAAVTPPPAQRLADAKSNGRYGLVRSLDNTEQIGAILARFVRFNRSYQTLNNYYQTADSLVPADLHSAAKKYFTDARLAVTTLSDKPMPPEMARSPALSSLAAPNGKSSDGAKLEYIVKSSLLPQLTVKLLFKAGSARDPAAKEGLAALTASMVAEAGSRQMRIDEIHKAFYPMAASLSAQVDKEMTTFTASVHKDNWGRFAGIALPMLTEPGFREDDFKRLKEAQLNALREDLRSNNEEELGKERLQTNLFAGTPYGHPVLGTLSGIQAITLDDVRSFWRNAYARSNALMGIAGDAPPEVKSRLAGALDQLQGQSTLSDLGKITGRRPQGFEVEIVQKETRAAAISFGLPIEVTRSHPDFVALSVARTWLGEHRSSTSHLYNRLREIRGMNYGDYAYIEAFPRGMFQFFPDPNIARRAQIFEVWIRPVVPENAQMAIRIALHELTKLIDNGLSAEDFVKTRDYLMKNVYLMTATSDQQLGYALDSRWYGIGEFTQMMRQKLQKLTVGEVNQAIRTHLSAKDLAFVIITKDAQGLKQQLLSDAFSPIKYDGEKPPELLAEDKVIGALKLNLSPEKVRITPVDQVFAK